MPAQLETYDLMTIGPEIPESDVSMFLNYYCGGTNVSAVEELLSIENQLLTHGPTLLERMGIA